MRKSLWKIRKFDKKRTGYNLKNFVIRRILPILPHQISTSSTSYGATYEESPFLRTSWLLHPFQEWDKKTRSLVGNLSEILTFFKGTTATTVIGCNLAVRSISTYLLFKFPKRTSFVPTPQRQHPSIQTPPTSRVERKKRKENVAKTCNSPP